VDYRRAEDAALIELTGIAEEFFTSAAAYDRQALQYLEASLAIAQQQSNPSAALKTHLNLLPLYRRQEDTAAISATRQSIGALIERLPPSRETAYGAISLG
jgi:hypothetical protein